MGCCSSKLNTQESISRCKARRRYMKQLVRARQSFSYSHSLYIHSLKSTGSALLQFANAESSYYQKSQENVPIVQNNQSSIISSQKIQLPLSPSPSVWTNSSSITASPILPPPRPPHLPNSWDFWDPFAASCSHSVNEEEEWDAPPPPVKENNKITNKCVNVANGGLEMVVANNKNKKDLNDIVKELDEYFLKAADAGIRVSGFLETPSCLQSSSSNQGVMGKIGSYGRSLSTWGNPKSNTCGFSNFERSSEEISTSHSTTVEKLFAWEKKLYLEVKNYEWLREEHEKKVNLLRKQELKGVDYVKIEKNKREIESLESKMMVSSQARETTSSEIARLRESELLPQLLQLLNGLTSMWRSMYECHQVQTHIVQQLSYLTTAPPPFTTPTSDIHRQFTLQLELEIDRWLLSFNNLIKSQRDYIHSLSGWLRLSLFQSYNNQPLSKISNIYSVCEEWYLALDRIPDKVASEGIKSFLTIIHAIVLQQGEELKQKKKSESSFKDLEKKAKEHRMLESKYGPNGTLSIMDKRLKMDALKLKAEEEKVKYEKSSCMTRAMTINNLQMGFPNVFQAITGFASVCMQVFEGVYNNQHRSSSQMNLKLLT